MFYNCRACEGACEALQPSGAHLSGAEWFWKLHLFMIRNDNSTLCNQPVTDTELWKTQNGMIRNENKSTLQSATDNY